VLTSAGANDADSPGRPVRRRRSRAAAAILIAAVLVFVALFGYSSLTRRRHFSPDSMIYVQVARNWLEGRGLSLDILYFPMHRYPAHYDFPHPFVHFPPLYPFAIAALGRLGVELRDAALAIPVLALAGVLIVGPALMWRLYDARTALVALTFLLLLYPLAHVSQAAWSETPAILLWLLSLLVTVRGGNGASPFWHLLGGLLGGLAFATRYAFALTLPLGVVTAFASGRGRRRWTNAAAHAAAWMLVGLPVLIRSWTIAGYPLGPPRTPKVIPLGVNVLDGVRVVAGHYASARYEVAQLLATGMAFLACVVWLFRTRRSGLAHARELLVSGQRFILPLWAVSIGFFLVAAAAQVNLPLSVPRLMVVVSVCTALVAAAIVARAVPLRTRTLWAMATGVALAQSVALGRAIASSPPINERKYFRESQRLQWVARQTTPDDLLIADDAWDLGFDRRRKVVIFSYHNVPVHPLTGPGLCVLLSWARCEEHDNVYLILRDTVAERERWMKEPFLADLMSGRLEPYPHVEHLGRLDDAYVYRWKCGPCAASAVSPEAAAPGRTGAPEAASTRR
jgi:hypothetical protein